VTVKKKQKFSSKVTLKKEGREYKTTFNFFFNARLSTNF